MSDQQTTAWEITSRDDGSAVATVNIPDVGPTRVAIARPVSGGWHMHLGLLEDLLTGSPRRGFWSRQQALEADYAARYAGLPEPGGPA